ncbi:AzlD domain-containing protein [Staphylococcus pseudintermedius]|nr:AzlD domain-containing protein [Staphylococcus pseudintermedius]
MYVFWTIFLAGLGTLLIRITPFVMISRMELSDKVLKWLTFIPITLFTALVVDGFIQQQEGMMGYTLYIELALYHRAHSDAYHCFLDETFNDNSYCRYGKCGTVENYRIILTIICIRDRFAV